MLLTLLFLFTTVGSASAAIPISYTTDLEGHAAHWSEFLTLSSAFRRTSTGRPAVRRGWKFVFGGDVIDRHPGELEILESMVPLAELHPDDVHLLLGNRDVSKMRLIRPTVADHELPAMLKRYFAERNAAQLFEGHRQQLRARHQSSGDWAVAKSLVNLLGPRGLMRRYIQNAKVAHVIDGTLFVHGAWRASHASFDLHQTVERLNYWKSRQVEQWVRSDGLYGEDFIKKNGDPHFVFYSSYSDEFWNPTWPSETDLDYLKAAGIHRLVVGHRTYGETPALLRRDDFEIIFADTSECRGCGVPVVELLGDHTRIRTRLANGQEVNFEFTRGEKSPLGHWTRDRRLIVGRTKDGSWITFRNPGQVTRVIPMENLSWDGDAWVIAPSPRHIPEDVFSRALSAEEAHVRVALLATFDGSDLTKSQISKLIARAPGLEHKPELVHYLRLAAETRDPQWIDLLTRWHVRWTDSDSRSDDLLEATARFALEQIGCGHALESH